MNLNYAEIIVSRDKTYLYDAYLNSLVEIFENSEQNINENIEAKLKSKLKEMIDSGKIRDVLSTSLPEINIKNLYDVNSIKKIINKHRKLLILSITNHCNMDCTYCIYHDKFRDKKYKNSTMSFVVAKKAIDEMLYYSTDCDKIHIGFYGGESLSEFHLIKKCVDYAKNKCPGIVLTFGLTTNGIFLADEEIRNYLIDNNIDIVVSLDGPRKINDAYRKDKLGKGSYDRVIEVLKKIKHENPVYLRMHVSINAVGTFQNTSEVIDDLFSNFDINYHTSELSETAYFIENQINIKNIYTERISSNNDYIFSDIYKEKVIRSFRAYLPRNDKVNYIIPGGPCMPVYLRLYVNTDGEYYPCERIDETDEYCIGNVNQGVNFEKIYSLYEKYFNTANTKCIGCWAFRICGRCFKNINDDCEKLKNRLLKNYVFFLDNVYTDKAACRMIENEYK